MSTGRAQEMQKGSGQGAVVSGEFLAGLLSEHNISCRGGRIRPPCGVAPGRMRPGLRV